MCIRDRVSTQSTGACLEFTMLAGTRALQAAFRGTRATVRTQGVFARSHGTIGMTAAPPITANDWHGTTIVSVRKGDKVVIAGDGQVTVGGAVVMKPNAIKVRRLGKDVIAGFAGSTADAITLFERLEARIEEYPGQLLRACVELAKAWRTDKYLRKLDALIIVSDAEVSLMITGTGDVLEPAHGVVAIGSGGSYALAAARALMDTDLSAEAIARKSMGIAAEMCVYTNDQLTVESIDLTPTEDEESK
eukprot:TRINITY_DN16097_c0_g1_i1.p1 TRINITY_DN16097_c0_g1~~TRINITY_DN16097_c0_g1_i1.p1  ORF type:complete len:248 (-),score=52.58 TRINITY_DN16097_c0_g1_i1:450-1193(-)